MMRSFLFLIFHVSGSVFLRAQVAPQNLEQLQQYERQLSELSFHIVNDSLQKDRADACFKFIPKLVEALKVKGSFGYPFDSLHTVSILTPPDKAFRIFTWQLRWGNGLFRQYGAIQMNTDDLLLYPLFDDSDSLDNIETQTLGNETWCGAIYYNIRQFKSKGKQCYLLFGFDQNDLWSSKKLIDVLHFENKKPVFGAPVFEFADSTGKKTLNRFIIEYHKDAGVSLNYSEDDKMIVYDHLVAPEERLADLKFTFVPDGTYEGFKLKKGKWLHVDKIATININQNDNPPLPAPLR